MVNVSWNDAIRLCAWLSREEGHEYRLPTEAEWEYACRAGTTTCFSSGSTNDSLHEVANIADASANRAAGLVHWSDRHRFTSPVGSYCANAFGLHDMHGNVWEWCSDEYDPTYGGRSAAKYPTTPVLKDLHVVRGGSFYHLAWLARSANRASCARDGQWPSLGFRVARACP